MSLTISQLRERVAAQFSDVQQVSDSVVRFTRKAGDLPFAVYYLDITPDLPKTQEKLTTYQDRVIGPHYFEGRKSLQWSNYLYFVTSGERLATKEVREVKDLIERDRSYARKFIISEEELDSVLNPAVVAPVDPSPSPTILSVWKDALFEAGLDKAILSNDNLPTRLALIESSSGKSIIKHQIPQRVVQLGSPSFIRSLQFKEFRRPLLGRSFDFGTVNLIFGPNGSGKTSLLEAIELFYCGRNKRNPHSKAPYEIIAGLSNGRTDKAKENRRFKLFRDRNMRWYRQPEVRTNNLYLTFAQFNFLDTDAAVGLALDKDSPARIQNDLSKLLVGSEASKTWDDMERVFEAVASRLRELLPLKAQINRELSGVIQRFKESRSVVQESDSIKVRLQEMLGRLRWRVSEDEKEPLASKVVESLSELLVLAQQASAIDWTDSPVTLDGLNDYCHGTQAVILNAETDIDRLELLLKNVVRFTGANRNNLAALGIAKEASVIIDRGIPRRLAQRSEDQRTVDRYSEWLAAFSESLLTVFSDRQFEMSVVDCYETAVQDRANLDALLLKAKEEYSSFVNLREQVVSLGQELRQIAHRITEMSDEHDECPLCHTRFGPGELQTHINRGVDQHIEAAGQAVLKIVRDREDQVEKIAAVEAASGWLISFIQSANMVRNVSIRYALAEVAVVRRILEETRKRLEELDSELLAFESEGLSGMKPDEISLRLQQFGYPLEELSRESVERVSAAIELELAVSSTRLQTERDEANKLQQNLGLVLGATDPTLHEFTIQDARSAVSRLKEKLATTDSLRSKLESLTRSFPWPGSKPLAELALEAESVRKVAAELQAAIGREKQAQTTQAESVLRKEQLEQQRDDLGPRIAQLTKARDTLHALRRDHSITEAMKEALAHNRAGIELIFSRIHSPAEFSGLGSTWTTLVRKADDSEAKLSEISTGQRAAFALSIFLAQNAQLTAAPPVVLIDDPIAHIDDLNCLSFLDYLREIVLTGRRQIFFATADDKLGTLFERKFDFLGAEGLRRFNLSCEGATVAS